MYKRQEPISRDPKERNRIVSWSSSDMFSRLLASNTALFVCDVHGAFVKAIYGIDELIGNTKFLLQCARVLKFPCVITEQYPEKLQHTGWRDDAPPDV